MSGSDSPAGQPPTGKAGFQAIPFLVSDALAVSCAGAVAVLTRHFLNGHFYLIFYLKMTSVVAFFIAAYALLGLYRTVALHPVTEFRGVFLGTTFTVLLLGTLTFFIRNAEYFSRAILLASWALIILLVSFGRNVTRNHFSRKEWWGKPVVILGASHTGCEAAASLQRKPQTGLRVLAVLDDDPAALVRAGQLGQVLLGPLGTAASLAAAGVRYAIVAMPHLRSDELAEVIERHASGFHHLIIIPDLLGITCLDVDTRDIGGMLGLSVSHRLVHRAPQIVKRIFDLTATFVGGVVIVPVVAIIYISIRLTSAGPGFYSQNRIGKNGNIFKAWKFRSMMKDSEQLLLQHLAADPELQKEWARDQKLRNDPRVTTVGRILRKTSLDELPQLWNVIRGEMSLVGPRPIVDDEITRYGKRYSLYMKVRPGLTGMWQVSGRNNTTYTERVQFDEYYVRNWSVWLDLYIIGRTVRVVMGKEGAY